jgi:hypothetical protein
MSSTNNGIGGKAAMYVDDMFLDVCTGDQPGATCIDLITNGNFSGNTGWGIPLTDYSAGYSTFLFHSSPRAMRTGIYWWYHNTESYSDFYQTVTIPWWARSASFNYYMYRMSDEYHYKPAYTPPAPDQPVSPKNSWNGDVQYLLLLDQWGNWLDTLQWDAPARENPTWYNRLLDLLPYAGQTVQLQFGTYNDGWGGPASMYIDDVSLQVCP